MLEENYVKNKSIDIVDTLKKYMIHIYKQKVIKLLEIFENNNFLNTIMVIYSNDSNK